MITITTHNSYVKIIQCVVVVMVLVVVVVVVAAAAAAASIISKCWNDPQRSLRVIDNGG